MCWIQKFVLVPAQGQPGLTSGTSKIRAGSSTSGSSKRHCRTAKVCPVSYQYGKSMTSVIPVRHKVCPMPYQNGKSMPSAIPVWHKVCSVPYRYGTCWYQQSTTPVTFPQYFLLDPASRSGTALVRHLITPITFPRCFVLAPAIRSGSASGSTVIPVRPVRRGSGRQNGAGTRHVTGDTERHAERFREVTMFLRRKLPREPVKV